MYSVIENRQVFIKEVAIRPVPDAFLFGYLSGSDPNNSPVTPLSNTLAVWK